MLTKIQNKAISIKILYYRVSFDFPNPPSHFLITPSLIIFSIAASYPPWGRWLEHSDEGHYGGRHFNYMCLSNNWISL